MIAAAVWRNGISFRPIFIGSLQSTASPIWMGPIWTLPPPVDLDAGTFVFTTDGALAGLAVGRGSQHALVPADTVLDIADRLSRDAQKPRGHLGIEAQPLTPALAAATGAKTGVIVSWVDPNGPAAGVVSVSDVIDRIGNDAVSTVEEWQARTARLVANESTVLGVRRQNEIREVRVTASAAIAPPVAQSDRSPGLTLRTLPRVGATVTRVDSDSPAARAGLQVGDVLTLVGGVQAPTAAQAARELAAAARDRPILLGLNRGATHYLLALERTW
jgi:S1-C subfamily serine protease